MTTLRVLIADDQALVREGLKLLLDHEEGLSVVGVAKDGREAVELARAIRPDVCLFDVRMPVMDGIAATRALAGSDVADPIPVVVITTFDLDQHVYDALRAGARGFLLKDAGKELLVEALRAAASGEALIAPRVTARLLARFADVAPSSTKAPIEALTLREEAVLKEVARGLTNAEIADALSITQNTVKTHIASLLGKLAARNRVELAMFAWESKRVTSSSSS